MALHFKQVEQGFSKSKNVELLKGGKPFFDCLLKLISSAKDIIQIQVYIFSSDETGKLVSAALVAAAKRGVKVYIVLDGYASQSLSNKIIQEWKAAGINFRFFEPLFKSNHFYFGRRLHHKLLVVDANYALVGGINIADRYNDIGGVPAWLDFALYVDGGIVKELCVLAWKTWNGFAMNSSMPSCEPFHANEASQDANLLVRMRRNDWVRRKNQISRTYLEMFKTAQSQITICCSYFLPGRILKRNIKDAIARGVKVRVILAGLSDVMIAKHAERFMYDWLLRNKVTIYEYEENVLHAKIAVSDGEWMTVGSYNVNSLSAYASVELNLDVRDKAFAVTVERELDNIIQTKCEEITLETHQRSTNLIVQFRRWVSYYIIRFLFKLFTFYFRQEKIPADKKN